MALTTNHPELEQYALDNYDNGGHWVYETHGNEDYQEVLDANGGDIAKAKASLKEYWECQVEQESNCRW
jgi:hypothetical protein